MTKKLNLANLSKNELTKKEMQVTGGMLNCSCYCYCSCLKTWSTYSTNRLELSYDSDNTDKYCFSIPEII